MGRRLRLKAGKTEKPLLRSLTTDEIVSVLRAGKIEVNRNTRRFREIARALDIEWRGMQPAGPLQDVANRFCTAYGVSTEGATLIRPDGFVAWRHAAAADGTEPALDEVLEQLQLRRTVVTRS